MSVTNLKGGFMCIPNQNYLIDALDIVLGWNVSDELLPLALVSQAQLMAGFDAEEPYHEPDDDYWVLSPESIVSFQ
jgi:hypothetical protein